MANHSSILALRTLWTLWKSKKIWHQKMIPPPHPATRLEGDQYAIEEELRNSSRKNERWEVKWKRCSGKRENQEKLNELCVPYIEMNNVQMFQSYIWICSYRDKGCGVLWCTCPLKQLRDAGVGVQRTEGVNFSFILFPSFTIKLCAVFRLLTEWNLASWFH